MMKNRVSGASRPKNNASGAGLYQAQDARISIKAVFRVVMGPGGPKR